MPDIKQEPFNPLQFLGGRTFVCFMTVSWFFHTGQLEVEHYLMFATAYMGIHKGSKAVNAMWNNRKEKADGK